MSDSPLCLDERFSTTRKVTTTRPELFSHPGDKFEAMLFLPNHPARTVEGGLRTRGYFKCNEPDKPLISVITVVFNGEKYLEQTIRSVIEQSYDNVEYLIIDGGSTDGSLDIIKRFEGQIDYWVSEPDEGIYDAMNKGIDCAQGNWIFFLGSDDSIFDHNIFDLIMPNMFYNICFIYGNVLNTSGVMYESKIGFKTNFSNTCHHQASFYSRSLFKKFRYNTSYKIVADYELNFLIYKRKLNGQRIELIVSLCSDQGVSHTNNGTIVLFDSFEIRAGHINYFLNYFFLIIGLLNFFRKKMFVTCRSILGF
jgi:glycosyltransferase involved in cell wall biosynthesis